MVTRRRRRGTTTAAAALALAVIGIVLLALAASGDRFSSAPQRQEPPLITGTAPPAGAEERDRPSTAPDQRDSPSALPPSDPVAIDIPAIDVRSSMLRLGTREDGSVEVPPYEPNSKTGWYEHSPTPGERGPAVVLGHVDSAEHGPAVFHDLARLSTGDEVTVDRADGTTAVFRVTRTERYAKDAFPTLEVYGNIDHPGLRLITCGGEFDSEEGSYEDNVVSYATFAGSHPTP